LLHQRAAHRIGDINPAVQDLRDLLVSLALIMQIGNKSPISGYLVFSSFVCVFGSWPIPLSPGTRHCEAGSPALALSSQALFAIGDILSAAIEPLFY
jgi:hypothetical protein